MTPLSRVARRLDDGVRTVFAGTDRNTTVTRPNHS
jgi:hypothetical protein